MEIELDYVPTERQALFHASTADELLYGGAAGGGKSRAVVMEALLRCLEHPGTQAYLFRRTLRELDDTLVPEALRALPGALFKYRAATHDMMLANGSVLRFRHCQSAKDLLLYQGAEIHWLFIDELTHFSKEMYDYLKTRLRAPARLNIRPVVRCTTNPGGPGHAWVKKYFVDAAEPGVMHLRKVHSQLLGRSQLRRIQDIPARATDNPHLTADYIFELEQKPRALREALLLGRWDAFEGQAFPEFTDDAAHREDRRFTHVIAPFTVPANWPRYRSFDFGYSRPFSVGWWAVDFDGRVYRYREWYGGEHNQGLKLSPRAIARRIREVEAAAGETHVAGVADPSIWDASRGESVAEQMEREGVFFLPGDNARLSGKMQLHERLKFDGEGLPGLYVFESCRAFRQTVPALAYDSARPEDIDSAGEDHVYDETRYFLMERPVAPRAQTKKRRGYSPLDE
ncbi:MAG: phage terminase large subunit [Eubacteriales bacterium]|nr:phage terminase large subunit [Eubacteriales bacterium]